MQYLQWKTLTSLMLIIQINRPETNTTLMSFRAFLSITIH